MKEIIVTVSSKEQVVIRKQIRDYLGIERGDKITFVMETEGKVKLQAMKWLNLAQQLDHEKLGCE